MEFHEKAFLLSLDSLPSGRMVKAKSAALRAFEAGKMMASVLSSGTLPSVDRTVLAENLRKISDKVVRLFRKTIFLLEDEAAGMLREKGVLGTVPELSGYDASSASSGTECYRAKVPVYSDICIKVRKKALSKGLLDEETFLILWLLRESGTSYDIFGGDEQLIVRRNVAGYTAAERNAAMVWNTEFRKKSEFASDDALAEEASSVFPFLERRTSVFIGEDVIGRDPSRRRERLTELLRENGHDVERITWQGQQLTRIDNQFFRILPDAHGYGRSEDEGLSIIPVYFRFDE